METNLGPEAGEQMTNEAQRIAIAEACGWTNVSTGKWFSPHDQHHLDAGRVDLALDGSKLPDYISDLNACHEMEKVLTQQQTRIYNDELHGIVMILCGSGTSQWNQSNV